MLKEVRKYWSFVCSHEIPVVDNEKYQCRGSLYTCITAWGSRNTGKGHLSHDEWSLSFDEWVCHLFSSDWSGALELVTWLLRLRLMSELCTIWLNVIANPCKTRECYVDLGMRVVELPKHLHLLLYILRLV